MSRHSVGIVKDDMFLGIRHFPDRKKASLVFEEGNTAIVIGTVRNEEVWEQALEKLFNKKLEATR